jgi:hypothetical protein
LRLQYIYAWKQCKESPCVGIFMANKQKHNVSLCFMFSLPQKQRTVGWDWHWWERAGGGEMDWMVNMVQIMYTDVHKCKNDTC